ncbi:hypothetical protein AB1Y20_012536 [Prymnesium parvum]|uniref:Response regulatory domain-containing protein n=1 Tax=Prymnesium parvum TaxID=97485 RepID=A0AB34IJ33_PRYPA
MSFIARLVAAREESAMNPITLNFYDKDLERALRMKSHPKLITLNAFLIASMVLMLGTIVLQQKPIPPWVVVILVGLSSVHFFIRRADPYLAHATFQAGLLLILVFGVVLNLALGLGLLASPPEPPPPPPRAAHECASCPAWVITVNVFVSITWTLITFWLHLNVSVKILAYLCPIIAHCVNPMYPELGAPWKEAQLIAAGLALGFALGHVLERNARQTFFETARHSALELRLVQQASKAHATAARVAAQSAINHTAKRVTCNTVQICEMALAHLEGDASAAGLRAVFATHREEARRAFHLCRSVLFRAAVEAGEYTPKRESFRLDELLEALTAVSPTGFECRAFPRDAPTISCDRMLLQNILLGVAHNALLHGGEGPVRVTLDLFGEALCLKVANAPGPNHAKLLKAETSNLLESATLMRESRRLGSSSHQISDHPSFLSLQNIQRASAANHEICSLSLRALPNEVLFELNMNVEVVRRFNTPSVTPAAGGTPPLSYRVESSSYDRKESPIVNSTTEPHPSYRSDASTSDRVEPSNFLPFNSEPLVECCTSETCNLEPSTSDLLESSNSNGAPSFTSDRAPTFMPLREEASTSASDPLNDRPTSGVARSTPAAVAVSDVAPPLPKGLVIVHADDDIMPRMFMEGFVEFVAADSSSLILGEEYADLQKLPQTVASIANRIGDDRVVVVLDQYMELPGVPILLGTDLCKQLREEHAFGGVVIILSANDEDENVALAMRAGADALVGKGVNNNMGKLQTVVASLYYARFSLD